MISLPVAVAFTLAATSCCLATETKVETRVCDAADGKGENGAALFQGLLKVTHRHDSNSKDGEDEGTSVTKECNKEPMCAMGLKCRPNSMNKGWKENWKWAGEEHDDEHPPQLWKSEELDRCMEKYKAPQPAINVDPADMYVICHYSEAKCSNCSCVVSKEAKGAGPDAGGAEIYLTLPSSQEGERLEHWMRTDINGISVWSSTTVVNQDGVFKLVEQILLSKGGKKGTLISGTHGDFAGNSGFEKEGVQEPVFSKDDLKEVKAKYSGQIKILSVSGFVAAAKVSGSSGGMDESMATNIANTLAGDPEFEPDFIVKGFCLSSTAGETMDEGIRQYAAKKGKASGDEAPVSDEKKPLKSALKKKH